MAKPKNSRLVSLKRPQSINSRFALVIISLTVIVGVLVVWLTHAGAPSNYNVTLSTSVSSAPADGHSVAVNVYAWTYQCSSFTSEGPPYTSSDPHGCETNGWGTTVGQQAVGYASVDLVASGGGVVSLANVTTGGSGHATDTVFSAIPGTTTINAYYPGNHSTSRGSTSLTFTAVPSPSPAPTPTQPAPKTTTTKPAPAPAPTPSPAPQTQPANAPNPTPTTTTSTTAPKSAVQAAPDGIQSVLVKAVTSKAGLTIEGVVLLGFLLFLLSILKIIKLPFIR